MANDDSELERRKSLSFEQAEGLVPLPTQLALRQTTPALRARLWQLIYVRLHHDKSKYSDILQGKSIVVMERYCVTRLALMADELGSTLSWYAPFAKQNFMEDDYGAVFGFTQWFLREMRDEELTKKVGFVLTSERSAYRVIEPHTIMPIASKEEGVALEGAIAALSTSGLGGARKHLVEASAKLTEGLFAESVRESVHAVESLVRTKTGKTKFSDALRELDSQSPMHGSFRSALEKLYGYASDEQGIRHPLLEAGDAKVTERDAIFVLGVCASFVTYLLSAPNLGGQDGGG